MEKYREAIDLFLKYKKDDRFLNNYKEFRKDGYHIIMNDTGYPQYKALADDNGRKKKMDDIIKDNAGGNAFDSKSLHDRLEDYFVELREKRVESNGILKKINDIKTGVDNNVHEIDELIKDFSNIEDLSKRSYLKNKLITLDKLVDKLQLKIDFLEDLAQEYVEVCSEIVRSTAKEYVELDRAFAVFEEECKAVLA